MLGRSRLRRGVSLEVIVEEDDNAEVTFDPTPLMEEDDDDDDDEDDDSENGPGGSAPSSPREGHGRYGGSEGRDDVGRSSAEERRRKRERRRTIGGLSRYRSVSCEALTLLDTSDMDSCCSEWDDDDELSASGGGSSNYVTLNRPISRRRIIENSQSQCDSEDSGIEYHSNEDDHVLEDHSSNEDHIEEEEEAMKDASEGEEDNIRDASEPPMEEEDDHLRDDDDEEETTTIKMESDDETQLDLQDEDIEEEEEKGGRTEHRQRSKEEDSFEVQLDDHSKPSTRQTSTRSFAYSPNEALQNDKIVIVETTPSVSIKKTQQSGQEAAEEEMRLKREAYTIRNKEVRLAELPKPHTVKSVKQLFENLKKPVQHFHAWRDLGRFRDIKSNPSSKILRFDRNEGSDAIPSRGSFASLTLPRLPSQGGGGHKVPSTKKDTTKSNHEVTNPTKNAKHLPKNCQETPMSKILMQAMAQKTQHQQKEKTQRTITQQVMTQTGEKVALRKPIVKGFNVKKALMENPRNFLPHNHNNQSQQQSTIQQYHPQPLHKHKSSQQSHRNNFGLVHKSNHHSEMTDRSDTESLASDISDDSGVSNDSLVSTTSSSATSSYRAFDAYASDPSFKWIDPAVMSKIRAVGTTVIFFGPRQRPRHDGSGTLTRGSKSVSSCLQHNRGYLQMTQGAQQGSRTKKSESQGKKTVTIKEPDTNNEMPIPAPRIVGVVRKQSTSTINSNSTSSPSSSATHTPAPTPTPTEVFSDDSRASSPASKMEEDTTKRKGGRWRKESDTVVYNFTRSQPQPPAVYF